MELEGRAAGVSWPLLRVASAPRGSFFTQGNSSSIAVWWLPEAGARKRWNLERGLLRETSRGAPPTMVSWREQREPEALGEWQEGTHASFQCELEGPRGCSCWRDAEVQGSWVKPGHCDIRGSCLAFMLLVVWDLVVRLVSWDSPENALGVTFVQEEAGSSS